MPTIKPFKGIYFNPKQIPNLSEVITPPYDNIPEEDKDYYLKKSPYNFCHVLLPRSEKETYEDAARLLSSWKKSKMLFEETSEYFYLYRQRFSVKGKPFDRFSLMCTVELSDFREGKIRPHENTHGNFKEDRLRILRTTKHNLSHIFAMVDDKEGYLSEAYEAWSFDAPLLHGMTGRDEVEHWVWRVPAKEAATVSAFFEKKPLYILDGHHRYSSSLMYAEETGALGKNLPASYMLFSIANLRDPALKVFPTHRRLRKRVKLPWNEIETRFYIETLPENELSRFCDDEKSGTRFALWAETKLCVLRPRNENELEGSHGKALSKNPIVWSDEILISGLLGIKPDSRAHEIEYERSEDKFWKERDSRVVVFHTPPSVEGVSAVADEGRFMPQKSTYFFPKLAAGLLMRAL